VRGRLLRAVMGFDIRASMVVAVSLVVKVVAPHVKVINPMVVRDISVLAHLRRSLSKHRWEAVAREAV